MNTKKLVKGCVKGDPKAQKALYDSYAPAMWSICSRYAKQKEQAEEIFQEGFLLVYKNIKQVRNEAALSVWIKSIFVNAALRSLKQHQRMHAVISEDEVENESHFIELEIDQFETELINLHINNLPATGRAVFNLYVIDGYKHHEIASMLNI